MLFVKLIWYVLLQQWCIYLIRTVTLLLYCVKYTFPAYLSDPPFYLTMFFDTSLDEIPSHVTGKKLWSRS